MAVQEKRSVKTQIKRSFMRLLSKKAYMDITISDLIREAQVSRMSFYRHFGSLNDVVEEITDEIIKNYNTEIIPVIRENDERKCRELLFGIIYMLIQMQKDMDVSFRDFHIRQDFIISRLQDKILQAEREMPSQTVVEKYSIVGKIGLLIGIVRKWALSGMQESPEEIVNVIMSVITKL